MSETSPLLSNDNSKAEPPPIKAPHAYKPGQVSLWRVCLAFVLLVIPLLLLADLQLPELPWPGTKPRETILCPQVEPLSPIKERGLRDSAWDVVGTEAWFKGAREALSKAIQVKTETFDDFGKVGEDPVWQKFEAFHMYLESTFPIVHKHLKKNIVNSYGLVYEWTGSNSALKPILLAAHQDTVPVNLETISLWTHDPWSGYFDGDWIWGRGSVDDKLALVSVMLSIETLLSLNFVPKRTVVLAFGFDEETSGTQGAAQIAVYLESTYGTDGFSLLLDEGSGMAEIFGGVFAGPGVGEKGYMDLRVEVNATGGHSSITPGDGHTGIGILSQIITLLENTTITPRISRSQPIYRTIQCVGEHAPDIPISLKSAISQSQDSDKALRKVEDMLFKDDILRSIVATTQAVDMIGGGVKVNALPELSWALLNSRIATDSSVSNLKAHYTSLLRDYSILTNTTLISFGEKIFDAGPVKTIELSDPRGTALEPAPVTPLDGAPWKLFQGTILATEEARNEANAKEVFVTPFVMPGNTDTRSYWRLTRHIFRYGHFRLQDINGIHTINERVRASVIREFAKFHINLILNANESNL